MMGGIFILLGAVSDVRCGEHVLVATLDGVALTLTSERFTLGGLGGPAAEQAPTITAAGRVGEQPFELRIDSAWLLRRGNEETRLEPAAWVRRAAKLRVLGVHEGQVWLGGVDVLARLDVPSGEVSAERLGRPHAPFALSVSEQVLIAAGGDLLACGTAAPCSRMGRLRGVMSAVVQGPGGWIYALAGVGLFRAPTEAPAAVQALVRGDVLALCEVGDGDAVAMVRRGNDLRVVVASTHTPAVRLFDARETVTRALIEAEQPDPSVVEELTGRATLERWPTRADLAFHLMRDGRPLVRRLAAKALASVEGVAAAAALWLLGHDPDPEVRLDALYATHERCTHDKVVPCQRALGHFFDDSEQEVAYLARDLMITYDPRAAITLAPPEYKLEVIPTLVACVQRDGMRAAAEALRLLALDQDPRVREAATVAVAQAIP